MSYGGGKPQLPRWPRRFTAEVELDPPARVGASPGLLTRLGLRAGCGIDIVQEFVDYYAAVGVGIV